MIATIVAVACSCIVVGFAAFSAGEAYGERNERPYWRKELSLAKYAEALALAAEKARTKQASDHYIAASNALVTKQRRVRGLLTEARRWKAIAASLGWKRETRGEMHARWEREARESERSE